MQRMRPDWYELTGRTGTGNLSIRPAVPPAWRPPTQTGLGEDVQQLIESGSIDRLGFPVRMVPDQPGKNRGDLLWSGGHAVKVVSTRFLDLLDRIEATGFTTCSVDLVDRKGLPIPGYAALVVDSKVDDPDIRNFHPDSPLDHQHSSVVARARVVRELRAAEVTGMRIRRALTGEECTAKYGTKPQESHAVVYPADQRADQIGSGVPTTEATRWAAIYYWQPVPYGYVRAEQFEFPTRTEAETWAYRRTQDVTVYGQGNLG